MSIIYMCVCNDAILIQLIMLKLITVLQLKSSGLENYYDSHTSTGTLSQLPVLYASCV